MSAAQLDTFADVDVIQIGARNMQNYDLLRALGRSEKPVLLKRGVGATLQELLLSAEYLLAAGNPRVMLCERGIRTFDTFTRGTLDLAAVPALHEMTHLPSSSTRAMRPGARPLLRRWRWLPRPAGPTA